MQHFCLARNCHFEQCPGIVPFHPLPPVLAAVVSLPRETGTGPELTPEARTDANYCGFLVLFERANSQAENPPVLSF